MSDTFLQAAKAVGKDGYFSRLSDKWIYMFIAGTDWVNMGSFKTLADANSYTQDLLDAGWNDVTGKEPDKVLKELGNDLIRSD